jgi:serine/threonine protein phosphatase PrpC
MSTEAGDPVIVMHALLPVAAGATDIGQRDHNEDHVLLRPELGLFIVADGAGGHNAGNVASALAATTVAREFETTAATLGERPEIDEFGLWTVARRLASAVQRANAEVVEIAKKTEKYMGMGTTIVAAAFSPDGDVIHIANVGDSRCYRLRGGFLEALTTDHSLVNEVLETRPDVDDALLAKMPRHVVTRALGMEESVRVPVRSLRVLPDDLYVLCTDGVSDALGDEGIEEVLGEHRGPDDHVKALIKTALRRGAEDNLGALVIACEETEEVPKRRPSARPPEPPPAPPQRPMYGSAPEIIIVGVETRVVPSESATSGLLDALGRFARLRAPSVPEVSHPKPGRCRECGQPLEASATVCPTCNAPVVSGGS